MIERCQKNQNQFLNSKLMQQVNAAVAALFVCVICQIRFRYIYIFFWLKRYRRILTPLLITLLSIINFARLVPIGALLRARESQQCGTMLQMWRDLDRERGNEGRGRLYKCSRIKQNVLGKDKKGWLLSY